MIELTIQGKAVKLTRKEAEAFIRSLTEQLTKPSVQGDTLNFSSQTIKIKNNHLNELNLTDC